MQYPTINQNKQCHHWMTFFNTANYYIFFSTITHTYYVTRYRLYIFNKNERI